MRKPLRPCREINCNNLTRDTWCESHKKNQLEITRNYNQYKRDDTINGFYRGTDWQRIRKSALVRDNYLCQRCLKQKKIQKAQVVHHVVEIKEDWNQRLNLDNLESLCRTCHNRHHKSKLCQF